MGDFINTIDLLGDNAVIDSLIEKTITEYKDNVITSLGPMAFAGCKDLKVIELPNVNDVNVNAFYMACSGVILSLPSLATLKGQAFAYAYFKGLRLPNIQSIPRYGFYYMGDLVMLVLENTETVCPLEHEGGFYSTQIDGQGSHAAQQNQGYVYVPNALVDAYKNATNWTTLAHKIRAIEDYTLSGTLKGAIILGDETEIVDHEATTVAAERCRANTVLTSVDLPNVEVIHFAAFRGCTALETISFPNAIKIGGDAFRECSSLKEVSFPQVTHLNEYQGGPTMGTFRNCTNLESIDLPNLVDIISSGVFRDNPALKKVNVPNWETWVYGDYMFYNDSALETLRLPKLATMGGYWFNNCTSLTAVILPKATMVTLKGTTFTNTPIEKGTGYIYVPRALVEEYKVATNWTTYANQFRALEDYTISGNTTGGLYLGDETEIVDDETTSVGASRFLSNTVLVSVDLPKTTSVGANAFEGCTVLEEVNMPLLKTMGNYVWRSCKKLKNISLPLVPEIGREAFSGCVELTSVDFQNVTSVGASAFYGCTLLKTANMPLLKQIGASAFVNCTSLEAIDFPLATNVGTSAGGPFTGCTSLKSVNLPIVATLFKSTFGSCTSLEEVSLPAATRLSNQVFQNCSALKSVDLPEVTQLDNGVFAGCSSLEKLDLLKATSLGVGTFNTMTNFKALILRSTTLCTIGSSNDNFLKTPIADGTGYIYVPRALVEEYKVATNWTVFANQFRALEDYTVDGTITGALDESKI